MKFALIALLYEPNRLNRAMDVLRYLRDQAGPVQTTIVINGNRIGSDIVQSFLPDAADLQILRHDNRGAEFGGYQAGLDGLGPQASDRLIVMNDTAGTHDPAKKAFLDCLVRNLKQNQDGLVVGRIDSNERRLQLDGRWTSRWVRSHLFGLDRVALNSLDGRFYDPRLDNFIAPVPDLDQFFTTEVRGEVRARIEDWLFHPGPGHWYGAQPLTASNCEAMAVKARAILQEWNLSMRLEEAGISFRYPLLHTRQEQLRNWVQQKANGLSKRIAGTRQQSRGRV